MTGIRQAAQHNGFALADVGYLLHGTTIATNAILEHDGAVTGMITTGGYRDILHIGRHQRPQHYSIMQDIPWQARPLVKRRHRKVVSERLVPPVGDVLVHTVSAAPSSAPRSSLPTPSAPSSATPARR